LAREDEWRSEDQRKKAARKAEKAQIKRLGGVAKVDARVKRLLEEVTGGGVKRTRSLVEIADLDRERAGSTKRVRAGVPLTQLRPNSFVFSGSPPTIKADKTVLANVSGVSRMEVTPRAAVGVSLQAEQAESVKDRSGTSLRTPTGSVRLKPVTLEDRFGIRTDTQMGKMHLANHTGPSQSRRSPGLEDGARPVRSVVAPTTEVQISRTRSPNCGPNAVTTPHDHSASMSNHTVTPSKFRTPGSSRKAHAYQETLFAFPPVSQPVLSPKKSGKERQRKENVFEPVDMEPETLLTWSLGPGEGVDPVGRGAQGGEMSLFNSAFNVAALGHDDERTRREEHDADQMKPKHGPVSAGRRLSECEQSETASVSCTLKA
jgi:hypothetical protein